MFTVAHADARGGCAMSRKGTGIDLAQALGRRRAEQQAEARQSEPVAAVAPMPTGQGTRAPSRAGQTNISGWFDMPVKLKLDELRIARQRALGRRVTQQELLSEAYNDLFKKYGLPEMAPGGPDR
jgi:hypothetical protein